MLPKDAPKLEELLIQSETLPWREKSLKGISEKMLWRDEQTGTLTAGSFYCNPKGNVHGPAVARAETVVIEIYDGPHYPEKPSWYTDERDAR